MKYVKKRGLFNNYKFLDTYEYTTDNSECSISEIWGYLRIHVSFYICTSLFMSTGIFKHTAQPYLYLGEHLNMSSRWDEIVSLKRVKIRVDRGWRM